MKKHFLFSALATTLFLGGAIAQNGASLNFDGSNDQANLGSTITTGLAGGTKVSVEAWVKPTSLSGLGCIVGNYNTGASALQILLRRSGNLYYEFWVGNGGTWYPTNSVATPTLNAWQHVAATWDGTVASIYVNGVLSGTTSPAITTLGNASGGPVWIGSNTINENFTGDIDEVRIWNSARTQSQIQASMDCQVPPSTANLLACYNFNEGTSGGNNTGITSVNDGSGNGNTAALNGFALSGSGSNFSNDVRADYLSLQSAIGSTSMADRLGNGYAIDYNNDGWKDVLATADNSEIRLYLNNGHSNFSNYTVAHVAGSGSIRAMGDMDNDGDMDYIITKPGTVTAYINNGNGTFTTYPNNLLNGTGEMVSAKIADINGDGKADLIFGNNNAGTTNKNEIWVNNGTTGSPSFIFLTDFTNTIYQTAIATGDVDEDGDVDILYGSYSNSGTLYLNNSNNGSFSAGTTPIGYSGGAELIDWNQDGHLDFINYEMYNRSLMVRYGYGNGTFSAISFLLTNSVINMGKLIDINSDGFLDFVASNWGGNGLVYINNGCSFTLQNSCNYNLGMADNAVTLADFNNDGTPDVFCQARDNKSSFYLNFLSSVTTPSLSNILSAPSVTACSGSNAVLSATASNSGTIGWFSSASGGSPVSTNANYTVSASAGTYTYYAGAVNANGCQSSIRKAVILTVNPSPAISVNSGSICSGQSFTISPAGALSYSYTGGSAVVSPTTTTSYSVVGMDVNGCVSTVPAVSHVTVNICAAAAALNLDGTDDFVDGGIGVTNALKGKDKLTVEAWVYPTQNTVGKSIIGNHQSNTQFDIQQANDKYVLFIGFGAYAVTTPPNSVVLNTWQHIAGVFNDNVLEFYINGVLSGTTAVPSSYVLNASCTTNLWIGKSAFGGENFQGSIDEVRIWDLARTQCEINTLKNCEIPTTAPGLLANYHFNQGVDGGTNTGVTTLTDASASAFTGTLTSMALTGTTSNWVAPGGVTSGSVTPANLSVAVGSTASNSVICSGNSTTLNGTGADTYVWTDGITNGVSFTPTVTATYTVTGTNTVTGCANSAVNTVTVNSLPVISVSSGSICAGQSYTIIASGALTYSSVPFLAGPVVGPTTTASYSITGTDANGCVSSNTAVSTVVVNTLPAITVNSGSICAGQSFTIVPAGATTYTYSGGSDVVTPSADATYSVSGTDANGCMSSADAVSSVTVNVLPTVSAVTNNTLLCTGETATLSVSGASTYTWSTMENTTDIAVSPTVQTTYTVMGTDVNGCMGTATITQDIDLCTGVAQIAGVANEFSIYPNPSNGVFNIHVTTGYTITILDVLGKVVYAEQLQSGTYAINLNQYANGLYILKAESNGVSKTVRLVKH